MQNHLEISCEQIDNHLKDTQQEKRRLHDQLLAAQQKIQELEEDVTQNRAHMDLYRIELEEMAQDRDAVKVINYKPRQRKKIFNSWCSDLRSGWYFSNSSSTSVVSLRTDVYMYTHELFVCVCRRNSSWSSWQG